MGLELKIKIIAENFQKMAGDFFGFLFPPLKKKLGDLALQTGAGGNHSLVIFFQNFKINPWFIVKTLQMGKSGQLHQVAVTLHILG